MSEPVRITEADRLRNLAEAERILTEEERMGNPLRYLVEARAEVALWSDPSVVTVLTWWCPSCRYAKRGTHRPECPEHGDVMVGQP